MGLQQDIVIVSQFGNEKPGHYIRNYKSRNGATESLEIEDYVANYSPRVSAVEGLKPNVASDNEVILQDDSLTDREGIMFGNHGISYSKNQVEQAAYVTQKAADEGHIVIQPVISFSHDYLKKQGIVAEDMPEPEEPYDYLGKVDQLKMRESLTKMMDKMHQEMGFDQPEWTGTIHFDRKHLHAHMTTIETGTAPEKRLVQTETDKYAPQPDMTWSSSDRKAPVEVKQDDDGFLTYMRDGEEVATQKATQKGVPKYYTSKTGETVTTVEERGMIGSRAQARMRNTLDRSLAQTRDIKPFVKGISEARTFTKNITKDNLYYSQETIEKMQSLLVALPENQKQWRYKSKAKAMQRPHEIANDIVNDIWTKYRDRVGLDEFERSVDLYVNTRDHDENLTDEYKDQLRSNAYDRLREETINGMYRDLKKVKNQDKRIEYPKQSIKAAPTEVLQNTISDEYHRNTHPYDSYVNFEYKARSYKERFYDAKDQSRTAEREIRRFDRFKHAGYTSDESQVIRDYYEKSYYHELERVDKYDYLLNGENSGVSKERFKEVRGADLVDMLYDYGPNDDRMVPQSIAEQYEEESHARASAYRDMMMYLAQTGQTNMYNKLKDGFDAVQDEAALSETIRYELSMPVPERKSKASLETRKTIDTFKGRTMLHDQLRDIESRTSFIRQDYDNDREKTPQFKGIPTDDNKDEDKQVDWESIRQPRDVVDNHEQERMYWNFKRMMFEQYLRDERRREENEAYGVEQEVSYGADAAEVEAPQQPEPQVDAPEVEID